MEAQSLLFQDKLEEKPEFLANQLITYIGNKRSLLPFIAKAFDLARNRLAKKKLRVFDAFSGSGVVARFMKGYAEKLITNDLEKYAEVLSNCYLSNTEAVDLTALNEYYDWLTDNVHRGPLSEGFITELYAPNDDENIKPGERVFYTNRNARYLDTARQYIDRLPKKLQVYFLAPLLTEASVHANTSGVFKGYYRDAGSQIGRFGGSNGDALRRIKGDIHLPFPIFSRYSCEVQVHREDTNVLAKQIDEVDLTYIDPPYNQHPYGSNYFMLNLLVDYVRPNNISRVSGIPNNWNRSDYNRRRHAVNALEDLIQSVPSRYLLISFNSEGFISMETMERLLAKYGMVETLQTQYNTFRGSRNLRNRSIHVQEYLFLLEKY